MTVPVQAGGSLAGKDSKLASSTGSRAGAVSASVLRAGMDGIVHCDMRETSSRAQLSRNAGPV